MRTLNRTSLFLGMAAGVGVSTCAAVLMGQGVADQPANPSTTYQPSNPASNSDIRQPGARMGSEYFVTGDGTRAHLWMRDGTSLRWVSSGDSSNRTMPSERPIDRTDNRNPETTKPGSSNPK
jgi:hypothetical protein